MSYTSDTREKEILVTDTRMLDRNLVRPIFKGVRTDLSAQFKAQGASSQSFQFYCKTPIKDCEIDRNIQIVIPFEAGWTVSITDLAVLMGRPNKINPRAFMEHQIFDSMSLKINGRNVTDFNAAPLISALSHYNNTPDLKRLEYSVGPTYGTCQEQQFSDIPDNIRSGLQCFPDSLSGIAPQAYPFDVTTNTNDGAGTATLVVKGEVIQNLWLSPLFFGYVLDNYETLKNVSDMTFDFRICENAANRLFAIDNEGLTNTANPTSYVKFVFSPSDTFQRTVNAPTLLIDYLTPQCPIMKHPKYEYPYFFFNHYLKAASSSYAAGEIRQLDSEVIRVAQPFTQMFIFARRSDTDMRANPFYPDVFFAIQGDVEQPPLEVVVNTRTVLGDAHPSQIYKKCLAKGLNLEYPVWAGLKYNKAEDSASFGTPDFQFSSTGSIVCLDVADLGLDDDITQDPMRPIQIQVKAKLKNISNETQTPVLYVVFLRDALMTIEPDGNVHTEIRPPLFKGGKECVPRDDTGKNDVLVRGGWLQGE